MNKEELLRELSGKVSAGEISREEVLRSLNVDGGAVAAPNASHLSVTKMLYVLGGAIVIIGIAIFAGQVWNDIGSIGRIGITLGMGLLLTISGLILHSKDADSQIGNVFIALGGLLIPGGSMVTLSEFKLEMVSMWPVACTFGAIFAFYLLLNYSKKNIVLTLFSVFNGTAFLYALVQAMIGGSYYMHGDLYAYLTMLVGVVYFLLADSWKNGWNSRLTPALYFLGTLAILGAGFSRVFDSVIWQLLYFILTIGGIFFSVYLKNRNVLILSTIFLLVHVSYITGKYFADSMGWPICLIVLGFIFIGLGYVSINLNRKYIKA